MKNQKETIRKMVRSLNNPDEGGGLWLPNIQRPFVWSEEQIERLFDSIMREYPISTLLVWKTKAAVRRRKFIDNYKPTLKLTDYYVPDDDKPKLLVLDGQQRLQSLFIALCGSYEDKELYFDVTSGGEVTAPDDMRYRFKFLDPSRAPAPWVRFKDLVFAGGTSFDVAEQVIDSLGDITLAQRKLLHQHTARIAKVFGTDALLAYQELDSIDQPNLYSEEDVVEVFIRANSGGTRLNKSDLLFSLLINTWDEADERVDELLAGLNANVFDFTRDFVLKSCLTLLGEGARYEVTKFRKPGVRDQIEANWGKIAAAVQSVRDYLAGHTFIRDDKAIPSYLTLIPLIYFRYHFPNQWETARGIQTYLLRTLLAGTFSGLPDQLIDAVVGRIKADEGFDLDHVFAVARDRGRPLELTPDRLLASGYGSANVHLLFNYWYTFDYKPSFAGNRPHVDHIFPQSALKKVKATDGRSMKYRDEDRNQLANCMLLTANENQTGGKGDKLPSVWFKDKSPEYLALHLIPSDATLWELGNYEAFIAERKKLILAKFKDLVRQPGG